MGDRVEVVSSYGERGSVDASDLPAVLARKGRVATPQELRDEQFGGAGGAIAAAGLGAVDTATAGGGTALAAQIGKWAGKQPETEQTLRDIKAANPIVHTLGSVAPFLAVPEAGGEEAAAGLIKGEGAASDFARWAVPHLARGTAETAWLEGAQGVSEDVLDHDLSAESFYVHALKPEAIYGGLLNVGVAGGFKGLGKLSAAMGRQVGGHAGELLAADAASIDGITEAVQRAGGTSEEANAAVAKVQEMANQRSLMPAAERSTLDGPVMAGIKAASKGDEDVARRLTRHYRDGAKVLDAIDGEMGGYAKEADGHMTSLINDLTQLEDARLNLKFSNIRNAADPSTLSDATDAANGWVRELRATLTPPAMPPAPEAVEGHLKQVLREWKKQGVKVPQDPQAAEEFMARARSMAEASHASETAEHGAEVQRLMDEREALVDPELRRLYGDPATRVGFSAKDHSKMLSLLNDVQREISEARKAGGPEGVARIYTALDDSRAIVGSMAKFGKLTSDSAKMLERYVYNNRLKPLLTDSNLWGTKLADLQSMNNDAVTHSIQAIGQMKQTFFGSLDSVDGRRIFTPKGSTKGFLESLGAKDPTNPGIEAPNYNEDMVRRVTESARARGSAMLQTMEMPPEIRAAIERSQKSATALEKVMDQAKTTAGDAREIRAMKAREAQNGAHGLLGTSMLTSAASAVGGPMLGGLVGAASFAYNVVKNPARSLEWIGQFRKAEVGMRSALSSESKGFIKGETVPVVKPMLGEAEKKAAIQSINDVQKYQTDPRALAVTVKGMLGDMTEASPRVATSLVMTIGRGILALAKRAPQPLPPRFTDKPDDVRYANGALEKYWRDKQLVESPKVVLQLMRSGQLHQEDMELVGEVVPRMLAMAQTQLETDMLEERKMGGLRSMSYQEQLGLSWMLGRPLDATQNPAFISAMQESAANDPMNQAAFGRAAAGGGRPSRLENINLERYTTLQEKLEA